MIEQTITSLHFTLFDTLEEDLLRLARYVEIAEDNFDTYSTELARTLFTAASEIDVVAKLICNKISSKKCSNIGHYQEVITSEFPKFHDSQVSLPKFGLKFKPWLNWENPKTPPSWWTAYNKVKHHRDTAYPQANLKNALNAVAALYITLLYYGLQHQSVPLNPLPETQLFVPAAPFVVHKMMWGNKKLYCVAGASLLP